MFSLEINFSDGVSKPETILIKRPQALIGATDFAHVVIEDMQSLDYQIRLLRDLGRRFRCKAVGIKPEAKVPDLLGGVYDGEAVIDVGPVKLHITALDIDLSLKEGEAPDRAGIRITRQAGSLPSPKFPAVVVPGTEGIVISFVPEKPIYIGRSNHCALRLDSSEISAKHGRLGFESGEFWIEDLGSTNGTFVEQQQISGRINVSPGVPITLGRDLSILGVVSEEQLAQAQNFTSQRKPKSPGQEQTYPILLSVSEVARPARVVVPAGSSVSIGRDPGSDMWLGAPHVSRRHCLVEMGKTGKLVLMDQSTNGTAYDSGVLKKGDMLEVKSDKPRVLNFGGGITVAICFDEAQEKAFLATKGSPHTFLSPEEAVKFEGNAVSTHVPGTLTFSKEESDIADHLARQGSADSAREVLGTLSLKSKLLLTLVIVFVLAVIVNLLIGFSGF